MNIQFIETISTVSNYANAARAHDTHVHLAQRPPLNFSTIIFHINLVVAAEGAAAANWHDKLIFRLLLLQEKKEVLNTRGLTPPFVADRRPISTTLQYYYCLLLYYTKNRNIS